MYGAVIVGLLFLAFAFFAVAQAGTVRNGGQSAADAAALAAAQDDRDQLFDGFMDALGDEEAWQDWLDALPPWTETDATKPTTSRGATVRMCSNAT